MSFDITWFQHMDKDPSVPSLRPWALPVCSPSAKDSDGLGAGGRCGGSAALPDLVLVLTHPTVLPCSNVSHVTL